MSVIELVEDKPKYETELEWAFPKVDPGVQPLGGRVLLQIRRIKKRSSGGLLIIEETKETEKYNTQIARLVAVGPLAFRKKDTLEPWPEKSWAEVGDFVRCPRWGGDRFEVVIDGEEEPALFVITNDFELIAKVTGDPLRVRAYL